MDGANMKRVMVFIAVLLCLPFVAAENLSMDGVLVTNCGVQNAASAPPPFTCGLVRGFSCDVNATSGSVSEIIFVVNRYDEDGDIDSDWVPQRQGSLDSGNTYHWEVEVDEYTYTLQGIFLEMTTGVDCSATNDLSDSDCFINFTEYRDIVGTCQGDACVWQEVTTCLSSDQTQTTRTPGENCDATDDDVTIGSPGSCDYCTPLWSQNVLQCLADPHTTGSFEKTVQLSYTDLNDCYAKTGLESDNNPPSNNDTIQCRLSVYDGEGRHTDHKYISLIDGVAEQLVERQYDASPYTLEDGISPLVYDLDFDGETETVIFVNESGSATRFITLGGIFEEEEEDLVEVGGDSLRMIGEASWYGFDVFEQEARFDSLMQSEELGPGFAALYENVSGGNFYFVAHRYNKSDRDWYVDFSKAVTTPGYDVQCLYQHCYFRDRFNHLVEINMVNQTTDQVDTSGYPSSGSEEQVDQKPIAYDIDDDDIPDHIAMIVENTDANAAIALCEIYPLETGTCDTFEILNVDVDDMKMMKKGDRAVISMQDVQGDDAVFIIDLDGTIELQSVVTLSGVGTTQCVSNPVMAQCSIQVPDGILTSRTYTSASGVNTTEYRCYELMDSGTMILRDSVQQVTPGYCVDRLESELFDTDTVTDMYGPRNIFTFGGTTAYSFDGDGLTIPVDVSSDQSLDVIRLSGTNASLYVSSEMQRVGELSLGSLSCTFDGRKVKVEPVNEVLSNPQATYYSAMLLKNNEVIDTVENTYSEVIEFGVVVPGVYTVLYEMADWSEGNGPDASSVNASCQVSVDASAFDDYLKKGCDIGSDGEFKYQDSVIFHGWSSDEWMERPVLDGENVYFSEPEISMRHDLSCNAAVVDITTRISVASSSNRKFAFTIEGQDASGQEVSVGSWLIFDDPTDTSSNFWVSDGSSLQGVDVFTNGETHIVTMRIDLADQEINFFLDDDNDPVATRDFVNDDVVMLTGIQMQSLSGRFFVDYVRNDVVAERRIEAFGKDEVRLFDAGQFLVGCESRDEAGTRDRALRHERVSLFCQRLRANGGLDAPFCGVKELAQAIQINKQCAQEALNYCVDVTFPETNGFKGMDEVEYSSRGLDAVTACTTALYSSAAIDRVARPSVLGTVGSVVERPGLWLVIIGVLVLFAVLRVRSRG